MRRSSSSSSSRPLSAGGEAGSTSNASNGYSNRMNKESPARNGTNAHKTQQHPALNAKSRESSDDDWLSSIDEALATATDSPPTSDPEERVKSPPNAWLKPPAKGFAHMAPPHLPGARPPSPSTSALSAGPSNLSSAFTRISISQAARELQPGVVPRPIKRDSLYTSQRASGPDPIRIARTLPRTHPHPSSSIPRHPNLPQRPRVGPGGPPSIPPANYPIRPVRRHFEIRISNLPHGIRKDDLEHLLADAALHRAPFSYKNKKLNFWLHVPRPREVAGSWGKENDGIAFLSLPQLSDAQKFMDKHGRAQRNAIPIRAHGQALVFEAGDRSPPDGLLEWLNRVPYREKGDRSLKAQNDRKADGLVLERLEFGILCKDGIFSREYSKQIRVADPFKQKDARFSFDYGRRNLRLNLNNPASKGSSAYTSILAIRGASVRLIIASDLEDEHAVTLFLQYPPAFEEVITEAEYDEDGARRQYTGRQRRPALDEKHQEVSAHTSRTIRFVFDTDAQSGDFQDLLVAIGCPPAKMVRMETDRRRLYDKKARHALTKWLGTLSSRAVAFQLSRLFCNNLLTPAEILEIRPDLEAVLEAKGPFHTSDILHQYVEELMRMEDHWLDGILKDTTVNFEKDSTHLEQKRNFVQVFREYVERGMHRVDWRENYDSPVMQCLHVTMTPTSMILDGPYPDQSNRPLRKYGHHDHFIRVAFMDEDKAMYRWSTDIDWVEFLEARVGEILRRKINLAGRQYNFLGYSMSSLRNRSTWFCTPFEWEGQMVDADYIRQNLGDFSQVIRQPARYGARMAQAFTATDPSIVLRPEQIIPIKDVERLDSRGEMACFTDGVGKISLELAKKVWKALFNDIEVTAALPSAFQFRLGGYKGVLTVDSELEGEVICVRPSQQKFDAPQSTALEIAYSFVRHINMFLNRPLIKVLEDLQVPPQVFKLLLKDAVIKAEQLKLYVRETRRQLTLHGLGGPFAITDLVENIGALLRTNKIAPFREGGPMSKFIAESLEFAEVHILRMLKLKARIPVPDAHVGVAIADESGTLKEGEIYTLRQNPGENPQIIKGRVLLIRAPTVDVGDVQFAHAVGTPPPGAERFKHLPNTVIFSIHGQNSLLNSLSRGDMDGDLISVIYDTRLFPKQTEAAMQHKPKTPVKLDRDCTIDDVVDFVVSFFRNDMLGQVASRHLLIADQAPSGFGPPCGTRHPSCKKLAELQTIAVDAPKSGQSIDLREMPRPLFPHRPDFMAHEQTWSNVDPEEEALIYHSQKVLGVLYRAIRLSSREEDNQILKDAPELDAQYVAGGEDDHVLMALIEEFEACGLETTNQPTDINDRDSAWYAMHTFASDLKHIAYSNTMNAGHPLSEHELFTGTILHGALPTKTKQELIQRINLQCKELIDNVLFRLEGADGRLKPQEWANRVLAALRVAVSQGGNFGAQTFGCIAIRSALYILALMKDLQQSSGVVAAAFDYTGDQPFEPIISTSANLIGPSLLEDYRGEGELTAADATGRAFIDEDEGGEGVAWGNDYTIEKEDS